VPVSLASSQQQSPERDALRARAEVFLELMREHCDTIAL
jgi:hypothetical protein